MKRILIYFSILLFTFIFVDRANAQNYKKYISRNQVAAKGINFGIKYPNQWQILEADRPNIVAKIFSPSKELGLVITIKKFPEKLNIDSLTPNDLKEILETLASQQALQSYPGENSYIRGKANITLDNMAGSFVEFNNKFTILDNTQYSHMLVYTLLYKDCSISLNFGAKGLSKSESSKSFNKAKDVIYQMLLSFTVYNQYE